jgi:Transposase DDE domain
LSNCAAAALQDLSSAAVDSSHIRAMKGGAATGPSPVERDKTGSKHNIIVEARGIPLATITTGGNRNDMTQLIPLIEAVPPIRGKRGQLLRRPHHLYADRGYDHETYRDQVRRFEITPHIARRGAGTRLRPGRPPLGCGRRARATALVPPPAHPLGDPRRHPPRPRHPRLRHHLLPTTPQHSLLGVQNGWAESLACP